MKTRFDKLVSLALILSQLSWGALAYADGPVSASPEKSMLISVMTLASQDLPQDEMKSRLDATLKQYAASAPDDGRIERTQEALVSLGIFTPRQAQVFMDQSEKLARVLGSPGDTAAGGLQETQLQEAQMDAVRAAAESAGAQFSACVLSALPITIALVSWPAYVVNAYAQYGDRETAKLDLKAGVISAVLLLGFAAAGCFN